MNAGNYRFKLTWSSLWHLLIGWSRFAVDQTISILKLVLLCDISRWQGLVNFVTMVLAGARGVIVKAGQGSGADPRFADNWQRAKIAGIPRGSYWFYDSRVDPRSQAANWWNLVKNDKGELMHFADYEERYGGAWGGWRNLKIFLQEFMRLSGLPASKIGIYTGYYYWIAHSPTNLTELNWFGQFSLWLAWYTSDPSIVRIPRPWTSLILWQFGTPAVGQAYGAESIEIDQNWFNGDEQAYKARFGLPAGNEPPDVVEPPAPRPPIEPEDQMWSGEVVTNSNLRLRTYPESAPDTWTGEYVGLGEKFTGRIWLGNGYLWMRIEVAVKTTLIGKWVAVRSADGSSRFIRLGLPGLPSTPPANIPLLPLQKFVEWQDGILASNPDMYRVRRWGDPKLGRYVKDIGTSNFQAVGLYNLSNDTLGGVSNFLRIPQVDIKRLAAMQVEDSYEDKQPDWRSQKMNWLSKKMGTIYFYFHGFDSGSWRDLPYIEWGTIQLGGSLVCVEDVTTMEVKLIDGVKRSYQMARLRSFRYADWGRPLPELLAAGLVQRCFCSYLPDDKFGDSPKGIVYSPFWSPRDWTFIGPGQRQPEAFYIPMDWLTK